MANQLSIYALRNTDLANLNRDDAAAPKKGLIGGVERARHSSQAMKRPLRFGLHEENALRFGAVRTKLLEQLVATELVIEGCPADKVEEISLEVAEAFIGGKKKAAKPAKATKAAKPTEEVVDTEEAAGEESGSTIGLFAPSEIKAIVSAIKAANWAVTSAADKKALVAAIKAIPAGAVLRDAVDIALMGRMFASSSELNVEAALMVSHAISTHEATSEVDFFTSVDDLESGAGSAHMGTKEMISGTMGSTVILNIDLLRRNLPGVTDAEVVQIAESVINKVLTHAVPQGNRTTMLTNTLPQYAVVTVSEGSPCAVSYETPVKAGVDGGYLDNSIVALEAEVKRINSFQKSIKTVQVVVNKSGLDKEAIKEVLKHV